MQKGHKGSSAKSFMSSPSLLATGNLVLYPIVYSPTISGTLTMTSKLASLNISSLSFIVANPLQHSGSIDFACLDTLCRSDEGKEKTGPQVVVQDCLGNKLLCSGSVFL